MTLLFFLKLLGEYAFYFILANYFARQSGGQGLPMALVFLPPAVVCLSSVLHTKKPALEKLPLLLLLPAFFAAVPPGGPGGLPAGLRLRLCAGLPPCLSALL